MMPDLISHARSIALSAHATQKYGDQPYSVHLEAVDMVLCEFGYAENEELRAAAFLHDILEDTPMTSVQLANLTIPPYVIALVDAVTNQLGANRAERHLKTYPRIARIPDAVTLKLADRIANVRACRNCQPRFDLLGMYRKEHEGFAEALGSNRWGRDSTARMWNALYRLIYSEDAV